MEVLRMQGSKEEDRPPATSGPHAQPSKQSLRWKSVQGTAHPGELPALDVKKATNETKWKI